MFRELAKILSVVAGLSCVFPPSHSPANAEDAWYDRDECKSNERFDLALCLKTRYHVFAIQIVSGGKSCWLASESLEILGHHDAGSKPRLECRALDFARISPDNMFIFRREEAKDLYRLSTVSLAMDSRKSFNLGVDGNGQFFFGDKVTDAWIFDRTQGVKFLHPSQTIMFLNRGAESPFVGSFLSSDKSLVFRLAQHFELDPTKPETYGVYLTPVPQAIVPVSLAELEVAGRQQGEDGYHVLRRAVRSTKDEIAAAMSTTSSEPRLNSQLYDKAMLVRKPHKIGQTSRLLDHYNNGNSEGLNYGLYDPSSFAALDQGQFKILPLSAYGVQVDEPIISTQKDFGDFVLTQTSNDGFVMIEVLEAGTVRLHRLLKTVDTRDHAPDTPQARAKAAGLTLDVLCDVGLKGEDLKPCADPSKADTLFDIYWVTRPR